MSLLDVRALAKTYTSFGRPPVKALDEVYLRVEEGSSVGLVGESGSGKSTFLRCLMRLENPDRGEITFDGLDVRRLRGRGLQSFRSDVQMVFQDPVGSLNPRMTVEELVGEGLLVHHRSLSSRARRDEVARLLETVGMRADSMSRHPASFSGGQLQRIAIARALAVRPRLLVCDEPVSALDVSVQAQVLNLLLDMQSEFGLSILFVSHDLGVVRYLCSSVCVLQGGRIVEEASRDDLFAAPRHEYTRQLIDAVPVPVPPSR